MRWYDKDKLLGKNIDRIKNMNEERRGQVVGGIMRIIREAEPTLLDDHVMEFPLAIERRRWYDADPEIWLIINGLRYASKELLEKVASYMEEKHNAVAVS